MSVFSLPYFTDEAAAIEKLEGIIWPNGPVCVHCGDGNRIGRLNGKSTKQGALKCYACQKKFHATVGTVFEDSHVPLTYWMQAVYLLVSSKKGFSSHQLMRALDVQYKTAWFMTHRIREAMREPGWREAGPLGGEGMTVEADETYMGGKAHNRAFGPIPPKSPVVSLVERNGRVRSFHVPNVTANNLAPLIARHAHTDSRFMTDESNVYSHAGSWFKDHQMVNHSAKEYVRKEDGAYTNTIEGYFSILKRGIYGVYQHVSEAHLHRYLSEFDFRYSYRIKTGFDDMARFERALAGIVGKRLTYRSTGGSRATQVAH
jgi:transposase-like protein